MREQWFTLDNIEENFDNTDDLYCISVESEDHQFLVGNLGFPTHNSEEAQQQNSLKEEALSLIGSISRLGRAAGVHILMATQRPDAKIIAGEIKNNLSVRIACGPQNATSSDMILGNAEGRRIQASPKGRVYVQIHGRGNHGQGFFAPPFWLDEFLDTHPKLKKKIDSMNTQENFDADPSLLDENSVKTIEKEEWTEEDDELYSAR